MNSILSGFFSVATLASALTLLVSNLWMSLTTPLVAGLTGFDLLSLAIAIFVTVRLIVSQFSSFGFTDESIQGARAAKRSLVGQNFRSNRVF